MQYDVEQMAAMNAAIARLLAATTQAERDAARADLEKLRAGK